MQNIAYHRAVILQAFQGLGIGGIAAAGLFAGWQAQLVKQGFPQLLGAVQVEFIAHSLINAAKAALQLGAQHFAKAANAFFVHQYAGVGHIRQHLRQGKFDLIHQLSHSLLVHLGIHALHQRDQQPGIRKFRAGKLAFNAVGIGQSAYQIVACAGV